MKWYKVVGENLKNTSEFNNHLDASKYCIKHKGMLFKNIDKKWVKHKHWSELDLRVIAGGYHYTESEDAIVYKCKKCKKINITVGKQIQWCSHCSGSLIKVFPLDF